MLEQVIAWMSQQFNSFMGCVDSSAHTPSLFTNMKPALKQRLRSIIARDDIVGLVEFDFAENCPYNVELSESGVRWTALHFCCRFDAPACLEYFLKKCFIQGAQDYPFFVNQQTAEGLSCLHLCAMWSASRCLLLLLRYGALNISLHDHRHKTAEAMLGEYGMREMERLLTDFKAKEGFVTEWNFTLLQAIPQVLAVRGTQFYKEELAKMEESLRGKLAETCRSAEPSEDEVRMREQKGKLERQREEIHCELMKSEKMAIKQEKPRKGEEAANPEGQKKNEQAQSLSLKLKKKEQEIEGLKYNIQKLIAEKNDELLLQQIHRTDVQKSEVLQSLKKLAEEFQQFKYEILKNRQKYIQQEKTEGLAFLKEPNRKSLFSETSSKYAELGSVRKSKFQEVEDLKKGINIDKNKFNRLPEHIQERYRKAKEQGHFEDTDFPHNQTSLGGPQHQAKIKPFLSSLVWLKPSNFICSDFQLFDGIEPNDVKQGQLGVCYCLATISEYARTPKKIVDIFAYCDLQLGFYVLRFYTDGKPNYIVVDDYFPCNSVSQQPLFSKPIGNEIWVLLIEKAWAKIIGSYFAAEMMTPDLFMEDLTGSPTYGAWFKDKKDKMKDVITYSKKGYLVVLTTGSKRIEGIVNNHAYSLLKVIEHEGAYIYKLRNPWGRFEWNGCYGEKSTLWTPQLRHKCEEVDADDGIFFLAESEVLQAYDYYSIGLDQTNAKYSFVDFKSVPEETVYFKFTLNKPGMMAVRLTQQFKRIIKDKDYKYSPLVFQLGKIGDNSVTLLSEGSDKCYFGQKSVYATNEVYREYEAGQYFVRLKVQWNNPQKYNSAIFSVYFDEPVTIQRIQEQQGLQLWNKMLLGFIQSKRLKDLNEDIAYAMDWMRGQMICYSVLKESSKLDSVKVKWTFNANQLQNCTLASHKTSDTTLEFVLNRTNNCEMGTLTRIDISKSCKSGNVSIQSLKQ